MRRLDQCVFCYIVETLDSFRLYPNSWTKSKRRTGPVKVLFDFVDHVPTIDSDCARANEALTSSAAPIESSIVVVQLREGIPSRFHISGSVVLKGVCCCCCVSNAKLKVSPNGTIGQG
jgi:hypothetical protein